MMASEPKYRYCGVAPGRILIDDQLFDKLFGDLVFYSSFVLSFGDPKTLPLDGELVARDLQERLSSTRKNVRCLPT